MQINRTLALAVLVGGLVGCAGNPPPPPPEPEQAVEVREVIEQAPEPPAPPNSALRLKIAAVGDMMIGTDYPENRLPDDDGAGFLGAVTPWLQSADIAFGNLEGVLVDGGEPGKRCSNPRACYLFRSPTRYAAHYAAAGFDVLSLANNHARDFGEAGRDDTMAALDAYGIHHSGRIGDVASWQEGELRVGMIAFAVTRNSYSMLEIVDAAMLVGRLAAEHDILLVSFHGGAEGLNALHIPFAEETYYNEPRGDVVLFARTMVDAGADVILGHGPHVVRAMERYKGRVIVYSLGNFATYYGISVAGLKGVAPLLLVTIDGDGTFIEGQIVSTRQVRPAGPQIDPTSRALNEIRRLSVADFGTTGLAFDPDGTLRAIPRTELRVHDDQDNSVDDSAVD